MKIITRDWHNGNTSLDFFMGRTRKDPDEKEIKKIILGFWGEGINFRTWKYKNGPHPRSGWSLGVFNFAYYLVPGFGIDSFGSVQIRLFGRSWVWNKGFGRSRVKNIMLNDLYYESHYRLI